MVHARTFSFTDENVDVAFPKARNRSLQAASANTGPAAPPPADPALLLFQLRRAQSFWYQELYQSDPTPFPDPSSFLWQMCQDMKEWGDALPETLPAGLRRMFEQELRYSYVYCIAPSVRAPQITDYTRTLIFEYSLDYLNTMHEIAHSGLSGGFYTYHDAIKVYFMGSQLLAVLRDAETVLLSGRPVPAPMSQPGRPPVPQPPKRQVQPNGGPNPDPVQRSLSCLERVPQTFAQYGERWEEAKLLMGSFQQQSSEVVKRLRQIQGQPSGGMQHQPQVQYQQSMQQPGAYNNPPQQQHQPHQQQHQHQRQHQQQQPQQPWVGVNVSQMMHGGPPA